jgi:LCP family protein required for cell wall assembly
VDIPGNGKNKINAAYAIGGPPLLIRTVEKLTDVRIDHFAVVDFYGFRSIIDAIGGIDIQIPRDTVDTEGTGAVFKKGLNHFNGLRALQYVRQRHGLPGGDFDRVKRQQNMIRAVMAKVGQVDPTSDPVQAYKLLDALTKAVTVDAGLTDSAMRSLAFSMRGVQSGGGVSFLTAPNRGTGQEGDQSVVYLDETPATELWNALENDSVPGYLTSHQSDLLPAVPR